MTEVLGLYASAFHVLREFAVFTITQGRQQRQGKLVCGLRDDMTVDSSRAGKQ
jgi:hypothetical protein